MSPRSGRQDGMKRQGRSRGIGREFTGEIGEIGGRIRTRLNGVRGRDAVQKPSLGCGIGACRIDQLQHGLLKRRGIAVRVGCFGGKADGHDHRKQGRESHLAQESRKKDDPKRHDCRSPRKHRIARHFADLPHSTAMHGTTGNCQATGCCWVRQ